MKRNSKDSADINLFKRFLKESGIYGLFFHEVKRNNHPHSTINQRFNGDIRALMTYYKCEPYCIIDKSLNWNNTKHGAEYWSKMDKEFREFYFKTRNDKTNERK